MDTFKTYRQWCLVDEASPNLWPQIKSVIYNWLEKSNGHGGKYMRYEATTATSANQGSDSWLMPMEPNHMNILLTSWVFILCEIHQIISGCFVFGVITTAGRCSVRQLQHQQRATCGVPRVAQPMLQKRSAKSSLRELMSHRVSRLGGDRIGLDWTWIGHDQDTTKKIGRVFGDFSSAAPDISRIWGVSPSLILLTMWALRKCRWSLLVGPASFHIDH